MYPQKKEKPVMKRCDRRAAFDVSSQSGVSLLIIIISILIFAVLAAAMYAITSTSHFNQASSQETMKAFYLAEAGPRIVASEFKAATNKNTTLASLNGQTFDTGGSGQFAINTYPYWLYAPAAVSASNQIILNLPGGLPLQDKESTAVEVVTLPTRGILKLTGYTKVGSFTSSPTVGTATPAGTPITFNLTSDFPYPIPINSELFIGFVQNEAGTARILNPQTVAYNGNLILNTTGAVGTIGQFFPPENGNFYLIFGNGMNGIYSCFYDRRDINILNSGQTTLINVKACPPSTVCTSPSHYVTLSPHFFFYDGNPQNSTKIFAGKSLGIRSTGSYGN